MDIFVISLKNSDRRIEFDKLNKNIINYKYFNAIDGNTIQLKPGIIKKNTEGYSNGAIGCAVSHLLLWKKCIELNKPIIIMEDDAFVSYDFYNHLNTVNKMLPNNWDILQLCYNCDSVLSYSNTNFENAINIFTKKKFGDKEIIEFQKSKIYPTIAKLNMSFGTGSYFLAPTGAKKLIHLCFPMDNRIIHIPYIGKIKAYTIDCMMNYIYRKINAYVCPIPFVMTKHLHINYVSETKSEEILNC
jgi:GR25 family glycosyltransferase involved in LPS biosynthesis